MRKREKGVRERDRVNEKRESERDIYIYRERE